MTRPTGTTAKPSSTMTRQPHWPMAASPTASVSPEATRPAKSAAQPWLAICQEAMKPRRSFGAASSR